VEHARRQAQERQIHLSIERDLEENRKHAFKSRGDF
jgi:hypothetical protein